MNQRICLILVLALILSLSLSLGGCNTLNKKSWKIYNDDYKSHSFFFDSQNPFVVLPAVISVVPCYILAAPLALAGYDYDHAGSLLMWGPTSPFILFAHEPFVRDKEEVAAAREEELLGGLPDYGNEWEKERNWQEDRNFDKERHPIGF
jgi:hypothetical protein